MVLNSTIRQVVFWVVIIGGAILLYRYFHNPTTNQPTQLPYSELLSHVRAGQVTQATIEKEKVTGKYSSGQKLSRRIWRMMRSPAFW